MSLHVMQIFWGGYYFSEPRWQVPFAFAVTGVLLQLGLAVIKSPRLASIANLIFGSLLWWRLMSIRSVLHPDSPMAGPGSDRIQLFFGILLGLSLLFGFQVAYWWVQRIDR